MHKDDRRGIYLGTYFDANSTEPITEDIDIDVPRETLYYMGHRSHREDQFCLCLMKKGNKDSFIKTQTLEKNYLVIKEKV